eukprot:3162737-Alexandrium_andersonii.AAC.1
MLPLLKATIKWVQELGLHPEGVDDELRDNIELTVSTIDGVQGGTFDVAVCALPSDPDEWTARVGSATRSLTAFSRAYYQVIFTHVATPDSVRHASASSSVLRAVLRLQSSSST